MDDIYISADVEADGPIPGRYSMLSFGLAVAATFDGKRSRRKTPQRRRSTASCGPSRMT